MTATLAYSLLAPADTRELLVLVHGQSRAVGALRRAFAPAARDAGLGLLLPTFDTAAFRRYQVLGGAGGPLAAADALSRALDEAALKVGCGPTVHLLGFSGGAQFAHRYAMLEPQRIRSLVSVAAGWYTLPDPIMAYPYGGAASAAAPVGLPRLPAFLALPQRVMVGDHDTLLGAALRSSPALDAMLGSNRLERATRYAHAVHQAALAAGIVPRVSLELLPGTGHSLGEATARGGLVQRSLRFFAEHSGTPLTVAN